MNPLVSLVGYVVALTALYWVVRGAVRGGIEDAWARRDRRQRPPESAQPEST